MKIYRISQIINSAYDTYDSAIVVAHNEDEARNMHPSGVTLSTADKYDKNSWVESPDDVTVELKCLHN